jgi:small multidrug resistance pump
VWSGIGIGLIAIISFLYFKEQITSLKLASITLIALGVIGLNLSEMRP